MQLTDHGGGPCAMGSIKRPVKSKKNNKDSALGSYVSHHRDSAEDLSVSSRQRVREKMQTDIDAFLAAGGKIEHLEITMSAEKLNQRHGRRAH
jgi:hypothetical protein